MHTPKLGLKENRAQFTLLVIVNAFVGGMVGLERTLLPQMAEQVFALSAKTAIFSFIVVFGLVKALTNYYTGTLANTYGRRHLLIAGWVFGLPVPFLLMYAPSWNWVILANVLLGINQGLTWSSTVVMKIDLVGERQRGLAMGLNEFAGYAAVGLIAFLSSWLAAVYGIRPFPFMLGVVLAAFGLIFSVFWVRDTTHHVAVETISSTLPRLTHIFRETTWRHPQLGSVTQAGLVNNLNDGMVWGLFPLFLAEKGFGLTEIGLITAIYPAVWGIGQLFTGAMSDRFCKKRMLYAGMFIQGAALMAWIFATERIHFLILSALLGWGTAMVYPTFLATIAAHTHPLDRAKSLGIFRLWRDAGYALGAVLTGILADGLSVEIAIGAIAALTMLSGAVIWKRMTC